MKRSLHCTFLNNCVEEGIVPSGLKLKLKIYIGNENEDFQNSIDSLLDKVSLNICERLAEEQMKISIDIGKRMESTRDILRRKIDGNSLFNFDQEVYDKTESAKNSMLLKQNKKLQKLRDNNRQSQLQKQQQKQQNSRNKHSDNHSNVKTASQQQRKDPPKQKSLKQSQITTLKNVTPITVPKASTNTTLKTVTPTAVPKVSTSKTREVKRNVIKSNKNNKDQQEQQKNWSPHGTIKKSYAEAVIMGESESVTMTKTLTHLVKVLEQLIQKTYQDKIIGDSRDLIVGDNGKKNKNGENKFREVKRQC